MQFRALDLAPARGGHEAAIRLKGCAGILHTPGRALTGGLGRYSWGVHVDCGPFREW